MPFAHIHKCENGLTTQQILSIRKNRLSVRPRAGRVIAGLSQHAYDASERELEAMQRHIDVATTMLPRQQHKELNSNVYHGCAVYSDVGHLDPMKYFAAVYQLALSVGVDVIEQTSVTDIFKDGTEHIVTTSKGDIRPE